MSVINKMLRDLDAGQSIGVAAKPSMLSGLSAIRDTLIVGEADKNDRYVYTDRFKPFVLISLMLIAVLLALWYLMGFSNVGKPVSFKVLEPFQAQNPSPSVAAALPQAKTLATTPTPPSAPNSAPLAQLTINPNPTPQAEPPPATKPEQASMEPSVLPQAAQPMITLPEPASAMNSLNFARMLAEPPLPRAGPSAGKSPAGMADGQASSFPATAKTEKRVVSEAVSTKPALAAAPAKAQASAPITSTPKAVALNPPRSAPERASALESSAQAQKQAAVQETLAQAQNLWNAGSKEAAMELLREAVAAIERAKASGTLPLDSPALPSLVRELARMELAEGRASQVLDLLIRLEPLVSGQADLWAVRGNAAQRLGQHQQASNSYLNALKLRPNEPRWMLGAAVSLAAQGQMVAAAALTDKARMTGSVSPEVLNYMKQLGVPIR